MEKMPAKAFLMSTFTYCHERDFQRNDDVYEELDSQKLSQQYSKDQMERSNKVDDSNPFERERKPRSAQEMAAEAAILKSLFDSIK
eukprot:gene33570-43387_t